MHTFVSPTTRHLIFSLVTILSILATSPSSAYTDAAVPSPVRAEPTELNEELFPGEDPSLLSTNLQLYPSTGQAPRLKVDFTVRPAGNPLSGGIPASLLQRGEYIGSGFTLQTEMGDIGISETPNTVWGLTGKGGKFGIKSGNGQNAVRLSSFGTTGGMAGGSNSMLAGLSGEVSFLAETARLRSVYAIGRETLKPDGKRTLPGERRSDVLGLVAILEPSKGCCLPRLKSTLRSMAVTLRMASTPSRAGRTDSGQVGRWEISAIAPSTRVRGKSTGSWDVPLGIKGEYMASASTPPPGGTLPFLSFSSLTTKASYRSCGKSDGDCQRCTCS